MTRFGWMVVSVVVFIGAGIGTALLWSHLRIPAPAPAETAITTAPVLDPSALAIYTSGEYGFSFFYPASGTVTDAYTAATLDAYNWRVGATATGTLAVRVEIPDGEVRVGLSSSARERAACTEKGPSEEILSSESVGSTTWSRFAFKKLGTEDEAQVTSYRTLHSGLCYAVEVFEPLEAAASASTTFTGADIAQSFTFAT